MSALTNPPYSGGPPPPYLLKRLDDDDSEWKPVHQIPNWIYVPRLPEEVTVTFADDNTVGLFNPDDQVLIGLAD
ncbi:MAG: hypothetical protein ACXVX6_05360 [Mycobacterium sp.]